MALWGRSDNLTIPGAPTVGDVLEGADPSKWLFTAGAGGCENIPVGTTMIFQLLGGATGGMGQAVVESIIDTNNVQLNNRSAVPGAGVEVLYSEQPIAVCHDPGYNGWTPVSGSTTSGAAVVGNPSFAEIGRTQMSAGISTDEVTATSGTKYETGIGWVGIMTYMSLDAETGISTLRVKKEVFVSMAGIETGNRPYPDDFGG